jgi:hypothetical protein
MFARLLIGCRIFLSLRWALKWRDLPKTSVSVALQALSAIIRDVVRKISLCSLLFLFCVSNGQANMKQNISYAQRLVFANAYHR